MHSRYGATFLRIPYIIRLSYEPSHKTGLRTKATEPNFTKTYLNTQDHI